MVQQLPSVPQQQLLSVPSLPRQQQQLPSDCPEAPTGGRLGQSLGHYQQPHSDAAMNLALRSDYGGAAVAAASAQRIPAYPSLSHGKFVADEVNYSNSQMVNSNTASLMQVHLLKGHTSFNLPRVKSLHSRSRLPCTLVF